MQPGGYALAIQQYGSPDQDKVPLTAYTAGITLGELKIHTGDNLAVLNGDGLQNVASVRIDKQTFTPTGGSNDEILHLESKAGVSPADGSKAIVKLKDGRTMDAKISTSAPRPSFKLVYVGSTPARQAGAIPVTLTNKDDIPLDGKLTFVVQTKDDFPRDETIEVATVNNSVHTRLSLADNSLVLEDDHTAVGHLDPLKAFGESAFGRFAIRPVAADGTTGDWVGLGTLVRTPHITSIQCTAVEGSAAAPPTCTLSGDEPLPRPVLQPPPGTSPTPPTSPPDFAENSFNVPTPTDGSTLYLKLRDDPASMATVTLPTPFHKPAEPVAHATQAHALPVSAQASAHAIPVAAPAIGVAAPAAQATAPAPPSSVTSSSSTSSAPAPPAAAAAAPQTKPIPPSPPTTPPVPTTTPASTSTTSTPAPVTPPTPTAASTPATTAPQP